jgi:hypothetical protein
VVHVRLNGIDAVAGQRVGLQIGILVGAEQVFLAFELLEELQHAAGRLVRFVEEAHARLVGGRFLGPAVLQEVSGRDSLADRGCTHADARIAGGDAGAEAQQQCRDRFDGRVMQLVLDADQMAVGDVAGLVGDHADHLVRRIGAHQQPGVDEHVHAGGDEGVDLVVLDQMHLDRLGIQSGHAEQRIGIGADRILDFRVADQLDAVLRHRRVDQGSGQAAGQTGDGGKHSVDQRGGPSLCSPRNQRSTDKTVQARALCRRPTAAARFVAGKEGTIEHA